jgi:hypothetical protein
MLRQRVDRIALHTGQASQRRGDDDRVSLFHLAGEPPHPVHDSVDVDRDHMPVLLARELRDRRCARRDAGVQARELDAVDGLPGGRVGDVETGDEIELLNFCAFPL